MSTVNVNKKISRACKVASQTWTEQIQVNRFRTVSALDLNLNVSYMLTQKRSKLSQRAREVKNKLNSEKKLKKD